MLELYGAKPGDGSFASNCLLARRLAERGVRFIQLYHRDWDHHGDVKNNVVFKAQEVDQATAALITDLKQRGMLDDTLVIWGGEFGRTPMSQGRGGRDHHIKGFSFMLAGGGIKQGLDLRRDRRSRLRGRRESRQRARFPRDDAASAGRRRDKARGEVSGAGRAADRRARRHRRPRHPCVGWTAFFVCVYKRRAAAPPGSRRIRRFCSASRRHGVEKGASEYPERRRPWVTCSESPRCAIRPARA